MSSIAKRMVSWLLIVTTSASPSLCYAQAAASPDASRAADVSWIPPDAAVAVVAFPRRTLTAPAMEMLPVEVISAAGKQQLGIDPLDIEQLIALAEPPKQGPPAFGIVLQLTRPVDESALKFPPGFSHRALAGGKTLLIGAEPFLEKMAANQQKPVRGPLADLIAKTGAASDLTVVAMIGPIRPMLNEQLSLMPLPPPLAELKKLPELIDAAKIDISIGTAQSLSLSMLTPDEAAAGSLEKLLNQLLDLGQQIATAQVAAQTTGDDPVQQASGQYSQRLLRKFVNMARPQRTGKRVRIALDGQVNSQMATIGVLVALLLPAVQSARGAAIRAQSSNNMKQIGLGMHNYYSAYNTLPTQAKTGPDGKPLLSWRVHLLPFLEEQELYNQFHLDEPWDSEHNKTLIEKMPAVFRNPASTAKTPKSNYVVPVGKDTLFGSPDGVKFAQVTDGLSNTIMALEVDDASAVIWTKPDDFAITDESSLAKLRPTPNGGFNVLMADGSVRYISATVEPATLLNMLRKSDGK